MTAALKGEPIDTGGAQDLSRLHSLHIIHTDLNPRHTNQILHVCLIGGSRHCSTCPVDGHAGAHGARQLIGRHAIQGAADPAHAAPPPALLRGRRLLVVVRSKTLAILEERPEGDGTNTAKRTRDTSKMKSPPRAGSGFNFTLIRRFAPPLTTKTAKLQPGFFFVFFLGAARLSSARRSLGSFLQALTLSPLLTLCFPILEVSRPPLAPSYVTALC